MAFSVKHLCLLVVFVTLIHQGRSDCTKAEVQITQQTTGDRYEGKPQIQVTVQNMCIACKMSQIVLSAYGFQSTIPVDPNVFDFKGIYGTVNKGLPIDPLGSVSFTYVWATTFSFVVQDAVPLCH